MYEAVRSAVHRVNRGTRVVSGGLAWTRSSLPRLLKAFEGKRLDAVAIHPYGPRPRRQSPWSATRLRRCASTGAVNAAAGQRVRLDINRAGTWGSTNPRQCQLDTSTRHWSAWRSCESAQILPFEWTDPSWGLSDGPFALAVARVTHGRL